MREEGDIGTEVMKLSWVVNELAELAHVAPEIVASYFRMETIAKRVSWRAVEKAARGDLAAGIMPFKSELELRERLSEYAHAAWSGWIDYMFSKGTRDEDGGLRLPRWAVERWERQSVTEYALLSENEKESDRQEADRILRIVA